MCLLEPDSIAQRKLGEFKRLVCINVPKANGVVKCMFFFRIFFQKIR